MYLPRKRYQPLFLVTTLAGVFSCQQVSKDSRHAETSLEQTKEVVGTTSSPNTQRRPFRSRVQALQQGSISAPHVLDCAGGPDPELKVELVPNAVIADKNGERLEFHVELRHSLPPTSRALWRVILTDDRWKELGVFKTPAPVALRSNEVPRSLPLLTPSKLADGFYQLKVSAAATAESEGGYGADNVLYLHVLNGKISDLDMDTFYRVSRIGEAISTSPDPPPSSSTRERQR